MKAARLDASKHLHMENADCKHIQTHITHKQGVMVLSCLCSVAESRLILQQARSENYLRPAKSPWLDISQAWHSVSCHNDVISVLCTFVSVIFKRTQKRSKVRKPNMIINQNERERKRLNSKFWKLMGCYCKKEKYNYSVEFCAKDEHDLSCLWGTKSPKKTIFFN